jgi:hypothetical protein
MQTYHGSCHCGSVRFEIDAELTELSQCNCSMCSKKGLLACYVPPERFRLLRGEDELTLYQFNQKVAKHFFCRRCGIHAFGNPRSNPNAYLVNARCLDNLDLETAGCRVKPFDGRNWEAAYQARLEGR